MDISLIVALVGVAGTLTAAGMGMVAQNRSARDGRLFDARASAYARVVEALYEYERATYQRAKSRLVGAEETTREQDRQRAMGLNAQARTAIAAVRLVASDRSLATRWDQVREAIGDLNSTATLDQLSARHEALMRDFDGVVNAAQADLRR